MAPRWMLPSFDLPFCETTWKISQKYTTLANTSNLNNVISIDRDADMIVREFVFENNPGGEGGVGIQPPSGVRFRHGDGRWLMQDFVNPRDIEGPVFTELILPAGSQFLVDITNTTITNNICQVTLKGAKRFYSRAPNATPADFRAPEFIPLWKRYSRPPAGFRDEPFDFTFELSITASQIISSYPLRLDEDAPFFIRGLCGDVNLTGTGDIRFVVTDPFGTRLASGPIFRANTVGASANARPIYPEIPCPPSSVIQLYIEEYLGAAFDARFTLRGVKRFRE